MSTNIAINGFGRIGRLVLRTAISDERITIKAINDLTDVHTLAHLLKYDSSHGKFDGTVSVSNGNLVVNSQEIEVLSESDPEKLPWVANDVEVAVECTGRFRKRADATLHLKAGARKVIISAPATDPDWTVVMGVNHQDYDAMTHNIISNASCTTNCLAPVAKVLLDTFGIVRGTMTTIHAYTSDQRILDSPHKDLRRARAAGVSMIPTTTGAAKAVSLVIPELQGKLTGMAVRVPTPNVSMVDLVLNLSEETTVDEVNQVLKAASQSYLSGIMGYCEEPLVSIDFNGDPHSGIVDSASTIVSGNLAKIIIWYDNEFGYSSRIHDLINYMYR